MQLPASPQWYEGQAEQQAGQRFGETGAAESQQRPIIPIRGRFMSRRIGRIVRILRRVVAGVIRILDRAAVGIDRRA